MGTIIRAGKIVDGTGSGPLTQTELLFEEGMVKSLGPIGSHDELEHQVKDYSDFTIVPGLIDLHAHVCYLTEGKFQKTHSNPNRVEMILRGFENCGNWLEQGVTSIRVLGTPFDLDIGLKELIDEKPALGSRLFTAGRMLTMTGGKRDPFDFMKDEITGENNARRWTRLHMKNGAEIIKLYCTTLQEKNVDDYIKRELNKPEGSPDTGRWGSLTVEEINAVVTEAHKVGRTVAAHASPTFGIKNALKGGVDTIEHGNEIDEECIQLFLEKDATLVPTLAIGNHQIVYGEELNIPEHFTEFAERQMENKKRLLQKAFESGVKIATGTDGFILDRMTFADELELLVEIGLSPLEALNCATQKAAACLGLPGQKIGTLEKGKKGDLVVLAKDPLEDIKNIREVEAVYKEGELVVEQGSRKGGSWDE